MNSIKIEYNTIENNRKGIKIEIERVHERRIYIERVPGMGELRERWMRKVKERKREMIKKKKVNTVGKERRKGEKGKEREMKVKGHEKENMRRQIKIGKKNII